MEAIRMRLQPQSLRQIMIDVDRSSSLLRIIGGGYVGWYDIIYEVYHHSDLLVTLSEYYG